jgi:acyl-CoA hydrolase
MHDLTSATKRATRAFLVAVCLAIAACAGDAPFAPLPPGSSVLAFGDSVTYGTGAARGEDYPSLLAARTGWVVHNHGVPGDNTADGRARIERALDATRPALVIVEIGGNDLLRRRAVGATRADLRAILSAVQGRGIPVVLVAAPGFSLMSAALGSLDDAELFADVASELDVPLVPDVFAAVLSDPALRSDEVHPNAAGYRRLADGIAERLQALGFIGR